MKGRHNVLESFNELKGKVLRDVKVIKEAGKDDVIEFYLEGDDNEAYKLYHDQDCCECIY